MTEELKVGFKKRVSREFAEYIVNFFYIAFIFGSFAWYRRMILAEHGIIYLNYGVAIIEAVVLAKIIMIGDFLRLGRRFEDRPLIIPTLYRTFIFGIWVALFKIVEHMLRGLFAGKNIEEAFDALIHQNKYEILAACLMTFAAFIPFFAVKVLGQRMGEHRMYQLFFKKHQGKVESVK